jgi:hypothetical protein
MSGGIYLTTYGRRSEGGVGYVYVYDGERFGLYSYITTQYGRAQDNELCIRSLASLSKQTPRARAKYK